MTFRQFKKYLKEDPEFEREHPRVARGSSEGGEFTAKQKSGISRRKFSPKQEDEIASLFPQKNASAIAKIYGSSPVTILKILRRKGKGKDIKDTRFVRILPLNQLAFSEITDDSIYWMGLLVAEGSFHGDRTKLGLTQEDRPHIEKFKKFLKSGSKIANYSSRTTRHVTKDEVIEYTCKPSSDFCVRSKQIISDLDKFGIIEFKKKGTRIKGGIELSPHFWRGVIDGDGSLYDNKGSHSQSSKRISLTNQRNLCIQFGEFAKRICGKELNVNIYPDRDSFGVTFNGKNAVKIIKALYGEPNITVMDRYMKKAWQILDKV